MMDTMPEFKPLTMDERVAGAAPPKRPSHHSQTDWDFENVSWTLDDAIYKAAAPSLHFTGNCDALVKHATTGALSDGRLITWTYSSTHAQMFWAMFRNQEADGGVSTTNTYGVIVDPTSMRFYRFLAGAYAVVQSKAFTWTWAATTWYKMRVTWWTSVDRIYVRVEYWDGDSWETLGGAADTDFEDVNDLWKDNAVNRVGFMGFALDWYDDVEVWG